jgi:hypothetical protein
LFFTNEVGGQQAMIGERAVAGLPTIGSTVDRCNLTKALIYLYFCAIVLLSIN